MAKLLNIFIFLIYKAGEGFAALYLLEKFNLKADLLVYGFYGFLSLFQLVFFLLQVLPQKESEGSILLRYTTLITVLMGILNIAVSTYNLQSTYTVKLVNNDFVNLLFFDVAMVLWLGVFYVLHSLVFSTIIAARKVRFSNATILPVFVLFLFTFGVPAAFFVIKHYVFKINLGGWDHYLIYASLGVNWIISLFLLWKRVRISKYTVGMIRQARDEGSSLNLDVNDENEIGLIQSELQELSGLSASAGSSLAGYNGYLSQNILKQSREFGISPQGDLKTATVVTLYYETDLAALTAENALLIEERIIKVAGEYADEYDAYPFFSSNRITLVYGVPFYYEHQRYHALESAVKIMTDIETFAEEEGVNIKLHCGLCSGNVITGALSTGGPELKQYSVLGEAVLKSQHIAEVGSRIDKKMLSDTETVEGLRSKFFVEKVYKIKLPNLEEQVVNQIKV